MYIGSRDALLELPHETKNSRMNVGHGLDNFVGELEQEDGLKVVFCEKKGQRPARFEKWCLSESLRVLGRCTGGGGASCLSM